MFPYIWYWRLWPTDLWKDMTTDEGPAPTDKLRYSDAAARRPHTPQTNQTPHPTPTPQPQTQQTPAAPPADISLTSTRGTNSPRLGKKSKLDKRLAKEEAAILRHRPSHPPATPDSHT